MTLNPLFSERQPAKAIWITDSDPGADPANVGAGTIWFDTGSNTIKVRNLTNSAWLSAGSASTVLAASGSTSAPGLSFAAEPSTGFWISEDGRLKLALLGTTQYVFADGVFQMTTPTAAFILGGVIVHSDASDTLALRNDTTANVFRVYKTFTDPSNYERAALQTGTGIVELAAETAGTGTDDIDVKLTPAGSGKVRFGSFSAGAGETFAGYITVKDAGGVSRKLAVFA